MVIPRARHQAAPTLNNVQIYRRSGAGCCPQVSPRPRKNGSCRARRALVFQHAEPAHRQLIHLEHLETRLLDRQAADGEPDDRQSADGNGSNSSGAERQCKHADSRRGVGRAGDVAWHGRLPHRNAGDGGIGWKREVEPISLSRVDLNGVTRGTVAARRDHRTFGATTSVSGGTPWGTSIFSWEQRRVTPARRFAALVSRTSRTRWRAASPIFG